MLTAVWRIAIQVFSVHTALVWSVCHPTAGPAGGMDCFRSRYYNNQAQWGTCVTDAYILQKSKGRHKCRTDVVDQVDYCYYQCMLEVHDQDRGDVRPDCACDPDNPVTRPPNEPDVTTLPPECLSPDGTDCSWYRLCLEAKFQCSSDDDDYGIRFGEEFCQLYDSDYNQFSQQVKEWVDAVRKCFLVELVPLLRPFESLDCSDVKTRIHKSHAECYVEPYWNALSICQLPFEDFWTVFWTIRIRFASNFVEKILQLMEVKQECEQLGVRQIDESMRILMATYNITPPSRKKRFANQDSLFSSIAHATALWDKPSRVQKSDQDGNEALKVISRESAPYELTNVETNIAEMNKYIRYKRETTLEEQKGNTSSQMYHHRIAAEVSADFARQLNWDTANILWFAYAVYLGDGDLQVRILLADKTFISKNATSANLTAVVESAVEAFQKGEITISVEEQNLQPGVLNFCEDLDCQEISRNVTAVESGTMNVTILNPGITNASIPDPGTVNRDVTTSDPGITKSASISVAQLTNMMTILAISVLGGLCI